MFDPLISLENKMNRNSQLILLSPRCFYQFVIRNRRPNFSKNLPKQLQNFVITVSLKLKHFVSNFSTFVVSFLTGGFLH